ncbi:hypothetical protein JZ751_016633 [Albula glossodonta]|uniref:Uncharacterized protein n=1 Tax=Albula glossodonta TaxID=121402 RepID=A0A8T2MUV3_9TELE|nr:hypothetical protein JZ751_016633 [Albula glossodonta]
MISGLIASLFAAGCPSPLSSNQRGPFTQLSLPTNDSEEEFQPWRVSLDQLNSLCLPVSFKRRAVIEGFLAKVSQWPGPSLPQLGRVKLEVRECACEEHSRSHSAHPVVTVRMRSQRNAPTPPPKTVSQLLKLTHLQPGKAVKRCTEVRQRLRAESLRTLQSKPHPCIQQEAPCSVCSPVWTGT